MSQPNVIAKSGELSPTRRVLTVRERESLEKTASIYGYGQAQGDNYVPGSQGYGQVFPSHLAVNRVRLNEQQKQVMRVLNEGRPEPTTPAERDQIMKKCDELKAQFEPYLQTREEVHVLRRDNPAFFSAMEKAKKWQTTQSELKGRTPSDIADEWRNLRRRLEPEDEAFDSLDRLRKAK